MKRLWLDLGDLGVFVKPAGAHDRWQDHGLGVLRTILKNNGVDTDLFSTRSIRSWNELNGHVAGYDVLVMNVRSYTYPFAYQAARQFKKVNPQGIVVTGGMHATVAPDEMETVAEFDRICQGPGENVVVDLLRDPKAFPRLVTGIGTKSMSDWPMMDRTMWPNPGREDFPWPLEPECGWGPGPVATVITSRVCPWQCVFCNEASYIPNMGRKSVDQVIDELNYLDDQFGPLGSVVIHDSMFFQNPPWLKEWLSKYPRRAHKRWPYWAAARSDTVRQWPDLFEALVRETNWNLVSIGFESGSDRVLKILNKECTAEDNYIAIDLLNRIGDDVEAQGRIPPKFWANIMLGIPGETHDDAFDTIRMLKRMKRVLPSISYYAPYPGSALGYQLIAEGRSRMSKENYHRYPDDEKVKGIDYGFYRRLLQGKYDGEVNAKLPTFLRDKSGVYADSLIKA
ncbi:MAG: B12-binding domain-containing radical SAM protein [Chloroflexi bacterium]|nr:B12-binding domain-containing radical SAM protein [Chloroflexota bacterium]